MLEVTVRTVSTRFESTIVLPVMSSKLWLKKISWGQFLTFCLHMRSENFCSWRAPLFYDPWFTHAPEAHTNLFFNLKMFSFVKIRFVSNLGLLLYGNNIISTKTTGTNKTSTRSTNKTSIKQKATHQKKNRTKDIQRFSKLKDITPKTMKFPTHIFYKHHLSKLTLINRRR